MVQVVFQHIVNGTQDRAILLNFWLEVGGRAKRLECDKFFSPRALIGGRIDSNKMPLGAPMYAEHKKLYIWIDASGELRAAMAVSIR